MRSERTRGQVGGAPTPSWRDEWRFVLTIGITNVVSLLNYRASLFLVEHFKGLSEVGTYSVAVTVAELLWLLSSSVTVSAYSRIGNPDRAIASSMTVQAVRINVPAYAAASSLSAFYTNHLGKPQLSGSIAGLSLAISFGAGCVLVPWLGALGAAMASSLGYTLAIVAAYGVFLKHAGLPLSALWRTAS
jgi:O-antigen/teichoic acid export membrane protein